MPGAFKRVNVVKSNLLTFPKYQKQNFGNNLRGGIKNEVIEKLVRDPMLLNIIFKANKNKKKYRI